MKNFEAWIIKAENDLKSAKVLFDSNILDTAIYHTQQCAEKALKAYLAFKNQPLQKTHNIEYLVEICENIDSSFETLLDYADNLNPYDTIFRYPSDGMIIEPDIEDVKEAIEMTEYILNFVKDKIFTQTPQTPSHNR